MRVPIKGFEAYEIYDDGRVWSHKSDMFLSQTPDRDGYLRVHLYRNFQNKLFGVHRLVAEAFIPNPDNLPEINHLNGNVQDNRVENLVWSSRKDNCDKYRIVRHFKVRKHPPIGKYDKEGNLLASYPTYAAAARELDEGAGNEETKQKHIALACKGIAFTNFYLGYYWSFIEEG